ncbi:MAG TPA: glyceraldehyde 3-phosphate dehydrogenase NAD-binding domain-containing protein, partial [Gemmatimonadales bacterium]|nr:glyceraldehyde 3-phosphate dehydrogenase NAD-binding domain-containing protein [Gemmatimonadales bacterium]
MPIRVAINGFGRIGEMVLRATLARPSTPVEIVVVNDVVPLDTISYLLRRDSVHQGSPKDVTSGPGWVRVGGREIKVLQEREPERLPWGDLGIDVAVEATGVFEDRDGMARHLQAGATRVVLTAPASKDGADVTVCVGVNEAALDLGQHRLISNASCTTNCLAPVLRALDEAFGVEWGLVSTVHAYTGSQALVDAANRNPARGRAAALNIVPTSTGAAKAIGLVMPHLAGRVDGMAYRVPVPDGSVIDLVFGARDAVSAEAINQAFRTASADPSYRGVLAVTDEPLVSSDIIGDARSAIVDAGST